MNTKSNKVKRKPWLSRLNSWLHLWLGISSGIIVVIVALTGTLFVFCDDIIDAMAGKSQYVQEVQTRRQSPEALLAAFSKDHPGLKPFSIQVYKDPSRTARIGAGDKAGHFSFTWIDPYTGRSLVTSGAYYFFYVVAHVHSGEMPFGHTGNLIVQIATWIFLIELITGLVLWWPARWTRAARKQRFTIKWKASFKRVNYDLHNVPGFYSLIPALMITITGLVIINDTVKRSTHQLFGSKPDAFKYMRSKAPAYDSSRQFVTMNELLNNLLQEPSAAQVRLSIPKDSATTVFAMSGRELGLKALDGRMFMINRYTGKEMEFPENIRRGLQVDGMNMNLHIGFWAGWLGKILTAVAGLICAALPVTGFLIWWGKRNNKKHQRTSVSVSKSSKTSLA
ncbi:MAG TPA: PepSY-associated TM helix domain-containing protein [Chitinophaga sp.]|uniref:PepSY-associated TM helix domain-containing protein n=1 Tax=Chitinophaga sp. TaxID=1869181 RepID=UPI002D1B5BC1|nr:PepSY-associated TM helix domain-containing protein [Chitinophaga sp.]HVI44181.1 PepSY-associated TM helix domain-containing protein [Chitinophaga sp.]